jgi:hypothetical protein
MDQMHLFAMILTHGHGVALKDEVADEMAGNE